MFAQRVLSGLSHAFAQAGFSIGASDAHTGISGAVSAAPHGESLNRQLSGAPQPRPQGETPEQSSSDDSVVLVARRRARTRRRGRCGTRVATNRSYSARNSGSRYTKPTRSVHRCMGKKEYCQEGKRTCHELSPYPAEFYNPPLPGFPFCAGVKSRPSAGFTSRVGRYGAEKRLRRVFGRQPLHQMPGVHTDVEVGNHHAHHSIGKRSR